ncbi:MAG: hypothetical protein ABIG20_04365, partial [archaeon]
MVYKRYVYINGKKYGPYYYKSVRGKNGKVNAVYVGNASSPKVVAKVRQDYHLGISIPSLIFMLAFCVLSMSLVLNSGGALAGYTTIMGGETGYESVVEPEPQPGPKFSEEIAKEVGDLLALPEAPAPEPPAASLSEELVQLPATVGQPVRWVRTVQLDSGATSAAVEVPNEATVVAVRKVEGEIKTDISSDKVQLPAPGMLAASAEPGNKVITVQESADLIEVEYETPAPQMSEETVSDSKKRVTIYSDFHYTNISAFVNIPESPQGLITLYHINSSARTPAQISNYIDSNQDGLIDRI